MSISISNIKEMKGIKVVLIGLLAILSQTLNAQSLYTSLTYNTGLPVGSSSDYISAYSWRGVGFEANWFLNDDMTLGVSTGWNVFYEEKTGEFTQETKTVTGTRQHTINSFPVLMDYRYHFNEPYETRPYVGMGVGAYWINKSDEMGVFYSQYRQFQLGLSPIVGVLIPVGQVYLNAGLRYNVAFKTNDDYTMDFTYLGINLGIAWAK